MKKSILLGGLLLVSIGSFAQNTYSNAELSSSSDLIGTARYVSMGGALGALGADISAISSNPAAIGMFRKSDFSLTAGALWPKNRDYQEDNLTHGSFDQMGFVAAFRVGGENVQFVNFAFNYQKHFNFANGYYADNHNLRGLSQADQFASICNTWYSGPEELLDKSYGLLGTAGYASLLCYDKAGFYNGYGATNNQYANYTKGSTQDFDLNLSFNSNDRYYFGFTLGCVNVDYDRYSTYTEFRPMDINAPYEDYTLYNDQHTSGFGVNIKLGTIIRPIEESPFRFGITMETPTWYSLRNTVWHSIDSKYDDKGNYLEDGYYNHAGYDDSYLEYNLRTPWRVRLSLGSTVGRSFAWGAEYEFANYGKERMSYETGDYYSSYTTNDVEMNRLTKNTLQGQHTAKVGFEYKPSENWALRLGYNYISSIYKKGAFLDSHIDSYAMDYMTSTSFMNLSGVNILTLGLGYKYKHFYADLVYKIRNQSGDFFAFDDSFTNETQFAQDHPDFAGARLDPVNVDLTRHQIAMTLGFKF